ncbi:hypothetical protein E8E12_004522 [Didymella heteroderae]|uniref:Uncharacterized protein n=1 Tax=Didymella heteroderae TaxID=1769908 RepID=A0A9P5BX07_9PLEO|nr:hypothetical protein E8E12_004522 [Didymella heteroderae]
MGDIGEPTTTLAEVASSKGTLKEDADPVAPPADVVIADDQLPRNDPPNVSILTRFESSAAPASEGEAASPPAARLIDSDPSKFRSLKRVIVIGRPGSGTDGVGDALTKLGFKVYDFQAASTRYERDFPLWVEAAWLRQEGRPYNKSDYDKLIGDHGAIVGMPACFFDKEIVKLYPGVKVILVTGSCVVNTVLETPTADFWARFDPIYHGNIDRFVGLITGSSNSPCVNNDRAIREAVREKNLLEIRNSIAWIPLCEFLHLKVPDIPAPELHDNRTRAELAARPWRAVSEKANRVGWRIVMTLAYALTMASVALVSALAAVLGGVALYQLSSAGLHLFHFLAARSQVRDTTRLAAAGLALLTFVCGIGAGYSIALMRIPEPIIVDPPPHDHRRKGNNGHRRAGKGRGRQIENEENRRPERLILDEWSGVQENIRKDDANMIKEGRVTFEEWQNGKHVTFYVTHKRTEGDRRLFSGPRKVLSVTEETVE